MATRRESTSSDSGTLTGQSAHSQTDGAQQISTVTPKTQHIQVDSTPTSEKAVQEQDLTFYTVLPDLDEISVRIPNLEPPNLNVYDNPFTWSATRKNICLILACLSTFAAGYSAGGYPTAAGPLEAKWHIDNVAFSTGLTAWSLGFGICPMILAPLSEINGRRPVYLLSGIMFLAAEIGSAATDSFPGMLIARFFIGAGAAVFSIMPGGIISDVFEAKDRNTPMALWSGAALVGLASGPLTGGFIVEHTHWRWIFWHKVMFLAFTELALFIFFKESRGSILLSRKAKKINQFYDQMEEEIEKSQEDQPTTVPTHRFKVPADEARSSVLHMVHLSITTPFKLLFTESVVFWFSLWASFAWGIFYALYNVVPLVFATNHNFTLEERGSVFATIIIGTIIATMLAIYQDKFARRYYPHIFDEPEGRLYFACIEACFLPIGLFWFGWTSSPHVHWIVPTIGLGVAEMGIFVIYLAVFNYLADTYHRLASSAIACTSFCRNVLGGVFPLFTPIMFTKLGYPVACSILGGIAAFLTAYPFILVWKGKTIRARSKVASEKIGAT